MDARPLAADPLHHDLPEVVLGELTGHTLEAADGTHDPRPHFLDQLIDCAVLPP